MIRSFFVYILAFALLAPVAAYAQSEAWVTGAVTDESRAVLPGATVKATEVSSGRSYSAVTDERGEYRLANLLPGTYEILVEVSGFTSVRLAGVELLVGQRAVIPVSLKVAAVEETVTVTAESPLIDVRSSQIADNVDRRQMEELPLQGRNWMELAMIVKGVTANDVTDRPGVRDRFFQLNLDGQLITQQVAGSGFGQPRFSREAIAEFQVVTHLFDISEGRSLGIQVQAVSRSGTNNLHGSFYSFFRDDNYNSKDFVANRILPYSNQQVGGTLGGPIMKDKLHYFVSYEYEREPNTIIAQPPILTGQLFTFDTKLTQKSFLGRGDYQISDKDQLMVRASYWNWGNPFTQVSGTDHPSQAAFRTRTAINTTAKWSRVIGTDMLQEARIGYSHFDWKNLLAVDSLASTPNYAFPGLTVGQRRNYPQEFYQDTLQFRYDLSWHREKHDFKIGGEYLRWHDTGQWQLLSRGEFVFNARPADLNRRFPADAWDDSSRWDVTGIDALVQRYDQNFGDWTIDIPRPTWGIWFGDTWRVSEKLILNLGLRWDVDWGAIAPPHVTTQVTFDPRGGVAYNDVTIRAGDVLYRSDMRDLNNVAPRVGFNWNVSDAGDFVIRGGTGLYYSVPDSNTTFSQQSFNGERILVNSFPNDRLPGFIQDPTRGVTAQDIIAGRAPLPPQQPRVIAHDYRMPYTWQSVVGFQKQLGTGMSIEADLSHWRGKNLGNSRDLNLFYNPVTGYNQHPTTSGRPDPKFTQIQWLESNGSADYMGLETAFTRRWRNNFQATATYTLMLYMHDDTTGFQYAANNPFNPGDEWARAAEFQRHTVRLTGIYELPWDISMAVAYFYGSGNYYQTTIAGAPFASGGTNRLNIGAPITIPESVRDRFDGPDVIGTGQLVPRNALRGFSLHKVDLRLSKDLRLFKSLRVTGIAEVFNLFNHANYGAYNAVVGSATFGAPAQNLTNSYLPRVAQFAFRFGF